MKVQFSSAPILLGHSFNVPYTRYELDLHRLVYSTSNHRTRNGRWSGGGGFLVHHRTEKVTTAALPEYTYLGNKHGGLACCADASATQYSDYASPSYSDESTAMTAHGVKGWKAARPGTPYAQMGQFIGELRDLPRVPGRGYAKGDIFRGPIGGLPKRALQALFSFRQLGGEYLNLQFGWKPFISDLQKAYKLTLDIDRRLAALRRNNGRSLKREVLLVDTTSVTSQQSQVYKPFAYVVPTPILGLSTGISTRHTVTRTTERVWFEGRFRYWVPDIGSLRWERHAKRILYGLDVSPSLVWELLPWSWLIDWFSTIGDSLANMSDSAVDNLIAQYAYVMRTQESETQVTVFTSWSGRSGVISYPAGSAQFYYRALDVKKSRTAATPYGFGVSWNGLTSYQLSILGALGVTRKSFT